MQDNFVRNKTLLPTHELYGVDPTIFIDMSYTDVLILKIKLSTQAVKECHEQHYLERDNLKMNKALSAIKFNEELLKEMNITKYSIKDF